MHFEVFYLDNSYIWFWTLKRLFELKNLSWHQAGLWFPIINHHVFYPRKLFLNTTEILILSKGAKKSGVIRILRLSHEDTNSLKEMKTRWKMANHRRKTKCEGGHQRAGIFLGLGSHCCYSLFGPSALYGAHLMAILKNASPEECWNIQLKYVNVPLKRLKRTQLQRQCFLSEA